VLVGTSLAHLDLVDQDGKPVSMSTFRGEATVLVFMRHVG
jgi:peroxiredoxin